MSDKGPSEDLEGELLEAARAAGILDLLAGRTLRPLAMAQALGLRERPLASLCDALAALGHLAGDADEGFYLPPAQGAGPGGPRADILGMEDWGVFSRDTILEGLRRPLGELPTRALRGEAVETAVNLARQRFPKAREVLVVGDPTGVVEGGFRRAGFRVSVVSGTPGPELLGNFGLVALVEVTAHRGWQENSMLFFSATRCLARHGGLGVLDWVRDTGFGATLVQLALSLQGDSGTVSSELDFRMWMKSAGLVGIVFHPLSPAGLQLILAQKGGRG